MSSGMLIFTKLHSPTFQNALVIEMDQDRKTALQLGKDRDEFPKRIPSNFRLDATGNRVVTA